MPPISGTNNNSEIILNLNNLLVETLPKWTYPDNHRIRRFFGDGLAFSNGEVIILMFFLFPSKNNNNKNKY